MGVHDGSTARASMSTASTPNGAKKRKLPATYSSSFTVGTKSPAYEEYAAGSEGKAKKPCHQKPKADGEKRLRRFRTKAPQAFTEIYQRATSQRFYVLGRSRGGSSQCPEETVELTGSTGNIYSVCISLQPTCTCPHAQAGNQCKHVIYVMSRVLRARHELVYQLALLSSELVEIFSNAPAIEVGDDAAKPKKDKNRKEIDGDCPICFMPFEAEDATVYCRAQCGQNIHKDCFEMWAATKRQNKNARDSVTCPMCRTPWQGDEDSVKKIRNTGVVGREGYVNIADQLGISTVRDTSTYYAGPRRDGDYYGSYW